MGAIAVREHQGVLPILVLEEVVDALVLEQAADEVEVGLPVLDAVGPIPVAAGEPLVEVGEAVLAEDLLDDIRDLLVLIGAAVGGARQEPEPGDQGGPVHGIGPIESDVGEAADVAVEESALPVGQLQRHGCRCAQQLVSRDIDPVAEERQLVLEGRAEALRGRHAAQQQDVLSEDRVDRNGPMALG